MSSNNDNTNLAITVSYVGWAILFFTIIGLTTWYTSTSNNRVPNDTQSQNKMDILNESMQTMLGQNWPYVLLAITVLIGIILFFIYSLSQNSPLVISFSDQGEKRFNMIFLIFVILFTITMIVLSIRAYMNNKNQNPTNNSGYIPSQQQQQRNKQILEIIGIGIFILIAGGFAVRYFFMKKNQ